MSLAHVVQGPYGSPNGMGTHGRPCGIAVQKWWDVVQGRAMGGRFGVPNEAALDIQSRAYIQVKSLYTVMHEVEVHLLSGAFGTLNCDQGVERL